MTGGWKAFIVKFGDALTLELTLPLFSFKLVVLILTTIKVMISKLHLMVAQVIHTLPSACGSFSHSLLSFGLRFLEKFGKILEEVDASLLLIKFFIPFLL
eukprot:Pompholyxophrys_punicea_v1_NODE_73_length_3747_cov_4.524377.p6 type:complete len:100 gc:universal NODE_73_length_3747_cov_4.524377:513-214(-)